MALIISVCCFLNTHAYNTSQGNDVLEIPSVEAPIGIKRSDGSMSRSSHNYRYIGTKSYTTLFTTYDYEVYKDTTNWVCLTGLNLTSAIRHTKNSGSKSLSFSISQTYSRQTANEFSTSLGGEAGVDKMVTACVDSGYGITVTVGREYQISSTVEATIPASADSGYYKLHVCYNYYAMKIIQRKDNVQKAMREVAMPYGESYAAVLYSSDASSWNIW